MQQRSIQYSLGDREYRLNYWMDGSEGAQEIVLCVHGLLRHSRDFDELIAELSDHFFCVSVDLPGRGQSDWFEEAASYTPENYLPALLSLIATLPDKPIIWVGTSLGGIMGMAYAATPENRLAALVLNDIGAEIPGAALTRIGNYITAPQFSKLEQVEGFLKDTYPHYQGLTTEQWSRLATYGSRSEDGKIFLHYDPNIAVNTKAASGEDISLWPLWNLLTVPVLVVQGLESDLLIQPILEKMRESSVQFDLQTIQGVGHAPSLMKKSEYLPIVEWIKARFV